MYQETYVLLAGVEIDQRQKLFDALGEQHHLVVTETVEDTVSHLSNHVDLVISDLDSRQVNSVELLRTWKVDRPRTPFLFLSDGKDVGAAVDAMKNGASDCIVKPVDSRELQAAVSALLPSRSNSEPHETQRPSIDIPPGTSLEDLERAAVEQALVQHHGNRTHAAKTLGISVRTLQRKLKAWGMPFNSFQGMLPGSNNTFMMSSPVLPHIYGGHAHSVR